MKKALLSSAALILAFGMSACSSTNSADSSKPAESSSSAAAPAATTEAPAPEATTEAATPAATTEAAAVPAAEGLTFKVTSSAGKGTVMYGSSGSTNTQEFDGTYEGTIEADEYGVASVTVTGDFMSQTNEVSCEIFKDGESVKTAKGSGQSASASCMTGPGL